MTEDTWKVTEERKVIKRKVDISKSTKIARMFREEYQRLDRDVNPMCRMDNGEYIRN
jgi:hypothetical protein